MAANYLPWYLERGDGPLIATAIHDGHEVRPELVEQFALTEEERLREEDPSTGRLTEVAPTRLIAVGSRFEVDFNRPRDKAVYQTPDDAWGLNIWKEPISTDCVARSLAVYDAFYQEVHGLLERATQRYGRIVVLDLHSFNHRRNGPTAEPADPYGNPEVNLGTGTMDRDRWAPIVDRFIHDLRHFDFMGRHLDVRENVKFQGGFFPKWVHQNFPTSVCVLSVEFKKFFMDEWTGQIDESQLGTIQRALQSTIWGLHEELLKFTEKYTSEVEL